MRAFIGAPDPRPAAVMVAMIFAVFMTLATNGCDSRPTVEEAVAGDGPVLEEVEPAPTTQLEESDEPLPGQPRLDAGTLGGGDR